MDIMILGIGGLGMKIASFVKKEVPNSPTTNVTFAFADTDKSDIYGYCNPSDKAIVIKQHTFTLFGKKDSNLFPEELFAGLNTLIVIAGLGGKTATHYVQTAIIAARNAGVTNMKLFFTIPWHFEGEKKINAALSSLEQLKGYNLEIFNNEMLTSTFKGEVGESDFQTTMSHLDKIIISTIVESIKNIV